MLIKKKKKRLSAYSWQRRQLFCQWGWSPFSCLLKELSRGGSSLIRTACCSLQDGGPGGAAEVPVRRGFVGCRLLAAENRARLWSVGRAVSGKGKARADFSYRLDL